MLVKIENVKAVKYVAEATTKSKTPALAGVHCDKTIEAADGFRLHAANIQLPTGLWKIDRPAPAVDLEPIEAEFPITERLKPKGEPSLVITIDAKLLRDALAQQQIVTLYLYDPLGPLEVCGKIDGAETYALIMPMFNREPQDWRPYVKEASEGSPIERDREILEERHTK